MPVSSRGSDAAGVLAAGRGLGAVAGRLSMPSFSAALATEIEERRPVLWLPVAAIAGVTLYLAADREPVLWWPIALAAAAGAAAILCRASPLGLAVALGLLALLAGFIAAELRARAVATPMLDRIRILRLSGIVEEVDPRPSGLRFVVSLTSAEGLDSRQRPRRVRLTARRGDDLAAGDSVSLRARLLPPAAAALPGGYDFARDAFFSGLGAVGSVLGQVHREPPASTEGIVAELAQAIDRQRNALAARVDEVVGGGDTGAIAAAMVTGKRDLLSAGGREIIREAGIFHIITIAGVQMTLVAGLLFGLTRRLLALSPRLALTRPIKAWAAVAAILGAIVYDLGTGGRVGTQRALFMTLAMLGAAVAGRRALTMRNLAIAALAVVAIEPEQVVGASFQLSFAAVAALIALQDARFTRAAVDPWADPVPRSPVGSALVRGLGRAGGAVLHLLAATLFATSATAPFMAAEFHELSPYVFVGNPLTLAMIEFFAVPGALVGTALYPLGLDAWVWHWVGLGIEGVMAVAGMLAAAPYSTLHLKAFAPWALPCLAVAVLHVVIWRTALLRSLALPWLAVGLLGAVMGPHPDLIVASSGDASAIRDSGGALGIVGHPGPFTLEQWLRADGDPREADDPRGPAVALAGTRCDALACVAPLPGGGALSLVTDPAAFAEDCGRATIVVTPLAAPRVCPAAVVIDRLSLARTGAVALTRGREGWRYVTARSVGEDRPWSPRPRAERSPAARGRAPFSDTAPQDAAETQTGAD